jgi:hypothetical protein
MRRRVSACRRSEATLVNRKPCDQEVSKIEGWNRIEQAVGGGNVRRPRGNAARREGTQAHAEPICTHSASVVSNSVRGSVSRIRDRSRGRWWRMLIAEIAVVSGAPLEVLHGQRTIEPE